MATINKSVPARVGAAITPSDSGTHNFRAVYVGTQGDLSVVMAGDGATVVIAGAVGWMPIEITRVNATNTTATGITGFN